MKKLFLFGTKLYVYLIELPVIIVLMLAIRYNNEATNLLKLYPLIVFCSLAIAFIAIYFFNSVTITYAKIKQIGLFSSRDSAIITKDRTIVLTYLSRRRMRIELFAMQDKPSLQWVSNEDFVAHETCVFRERVIGNNLTAKRVLRFFKASEKEIKELLSSENLEIKNGKIEYSALVYDEKKQIKIKFNEVI